MSTMKILIAYDGTEHADAAIDGLARAGLPTHAEALVLTISDVWIPSSLEQTLDEGDDGEILVEGRAVHALRRARQTATAARNRVQALYPSWTVRAEGRSDAPAWGILERINEWRPDLVVVGTHGRTLLGRMFLGSVSQRVLAEATCSVRIGRRSRARTESIRIIVGIDGSRDSRAAVREVACRDWPPLTEIHLVAAHPPLDQRYAPAIASIGSTAPEQRDDEGLLRIREQIDEAAALLAERGVDVVRTIRIGLPVPILLDEAEAWDADAIVLGARGHGLLERLLLGSVSSAVAVRAPCAVEVIRPWTGGGD
jgi:nucleotide-binding universal stress UspA family protein